MKLPRKQAGEKLKKPPIRLIREKQVSFPKILSLRTHDLIKIKSMAADYLVIIDSHTML